MLNGLPAGWRVSNSTGAWAAPAAPLERDDEEDEGGVDGGEGLDEEDLRPDSPGWEDVEEDVEEMSFKCLICDDTFGSARRMVGHGKESHGFDLDRIRKENNLNFYQTIQLINYVRSTIKHHPDTDISTLDFTNAPFEDEKYLAPVLEDDALLYSIDELADPDDPKDPLVQQREDDAQEAAGGGEGAGGKVVAGRALR